MIISFILKKEVVFYRLNPNFCLDPQQLVDFEHVTEARLLGFIFSNEFRFDFHM